jgi:separase
MAAEKTTTRARIESIKTDLRSISTCSTSTVVDVQELLADKTEDIVQKENIRARSSQLRSGQTATRKKTASTTVITTAKLASHSLAPRDKYILATEVANLTLKSLADALKSPPSGVFPKTKSTSNGDAPQSAKSNSPLQERFVSQVTNSPTKLLRSPSNVSCLTTGSGSGLVATAECARVAFAYMRTPEAMKAGGKQALQLQLENGMSALVGKMVAHGLDNLAIKELRVLKRRLDYILETTRLEDRTTSSKAVPKKVSNVQEKESIAALLDFGDINPNTTALPLIIAHQTHALRIIARSKRPLLIEETWQYLKTSHSSSLVNLLSQAATVANAEPKSLRQLESLAQTLLSMCPSISSAEDCSSGQDHLYLSPETVLSLQHLAFKVRQTWWKLAKHQVNEEKELFEPFSRCVVAFSRRSKLTAAAKYKIVDRLYQELLENAEGPVNGESKNCPSSGDATTKCLSALAQSAGLTDEAIRWLGTSKPSKTVNDSAVKMAPRLVRVAAISLDACLRGTSKTDIEKSFENALDAFSGGLSGSPTELEVLFAEVNSLRRIAAKAIFLHVQDPSNTTIPPQLLPQILRMASAGLHFTVRYLNTNISADTNRKAQNRHDQRFASVAKHTKSIVDTACLCSKLAAIGDADSHWSLMHTLFQNCLSIIRSLEVCPETGSSDNLQNPFVKISNAYWAVHLQLKMADGITMSSIMAMQASVDLLRDRSVRERQAGLIIMKLERLAEAYDALGRMEKSRETLKSCIATLIEFGDLQAATELGESQPISDIFSNEGTGSILGRVVKACQRTFIKAPPRRADELAYFDDSTLPAASRGLLLEWQLALFVRALSRNISWDPALHNSVERLSAQLLELYEPVQYPIRRQRVILMLLQLLREHPVLFSKQILPLDTVWEPNKDVSKSQDQALARYQCHLSALLKLKTALQESDLPMSTIEQCLSAWQSLTGSGTSWNDLTNNVDSIGDWVSELHTLADHLAAKGEDYSCIVALRLIARIFELEDNVDASRLITSLCALGLQLLRLGYTNKVAQIFSKVEHLVSRENTSTEAKLQWHIVYAEYLVEIGNLSKW